MITLLTEIKERGISLWLDAGALKYRAPTGAMDAGMLSGLRQQKAEIIAYLSTGPKTCQNCRACASWRGTDRCFARALFEGKPGEPGSVLPEPCDRWMLKDKPGKGDQGGRSTLSAPELC